MTIVVITSAYLFFSSAHACRYAFTIVTSHQWVSSHLGLRVPLVKTSASATVFVAASEMIFTPPGVAMLVRSCRNGENSSLRRTVSDEVRAIAYPEGNTKFC